MLELKSVTRLYRRQKAIVKALDHVTLAIERGEFIVFRGVSGSGKTTLLTLIAGFVRPSSGTVLLFNKNIASYTQATLQQIRARTIGFVFQTFRLIEALKVLKNIELFLHFAGESRRERHSHALDILKNIGVEHLADRYPGQLSQGEKQRVAIARAVANDAQLILADEPTASLAAEQGIDIIRLLHANACSKGKCVLVASHDLRLKNYADRIIRIENGVIISESGSSDNN